MTESKARGIQVRLLAVGSILVIVMTVMATSVIYLGLTGHLLTAEQQRLEKAAELSTTVFAMKSESVQRDVLIMSNSHAVQGVVRARINGGVDPVSGESEADLRSRLSGEFALFLDGHDEYSQMSFVGIRNNGLEHVRVQRDGQEIRNVGVSELKSRAGEHFLTIGQALSPGETRIILWEPVGGGAHSSTIAHAVSAVFTSSGRVFGIIALDIDLRILLARLQQEYSGNPATYIVDSKGRVLHSSTERSVSSGSLQQVENIADEFPNSQSALLSNPAQSQFHTLDDIRGDRRVLAIGRVGINPAQSGDQVSFIHAMPHAEFVEVVGPHARRLVGVAIVFVIISFIALALFTRSIIRPLNSMTNAVALYRYGKELPELPVRRNDQIGVLAREFLKLLDGLHSRQAKLANEVAERKHAESRVKASELRYKASLDLMRDAHFVSDMHGVIQSVNRAGETIFGYSAAELIGQSVNILLPEQQRAAHSKQMALHRATGNSGVIGVGRDTGLVAHRRDGTDFPIALLLDKFETDEGIFFTAIIRDTTHTQEVEAENSRLRTVVEHATDCIMLTTPDDTIEYVNPQFEVEFGARKEEILGRKGDQMGWRQSDEGVYAELHASVNRGEVWSGEVRTAAKSGQVVEHDVTVSPVQDDNGCVVNKVYIARNICERKKLEQQLAQAQKLESIGQLAAGIAHEINTPTQYVGDNTRFVKDIFDDVGILFTTLTELTAASNGSVPTQALEEAMEKADVEYLREEVPRALEQSIEGVERVTKIVRAMKEFSHPAQDKTPVDLNAAIESTVTVASNEWKYVADVRTEFDPELPLVTCMPGQFNQVILNMIVNAAHAIADAIGAEPAEKGAITITTRVVEGWAEVRITDTGAGMPDDVKQRVFDPFFTTKEVGKGTGQGLSIAHTVIVEKHGGTITVDSTPGNGTSFTIHLPIDEPIPENDSAAA